MYDIQEDIQNAIDGMELGKKIFLELSKDAPFSDGEPQHCEFGGMALQLGSPIHTLKAILAATRIAVDHEMQAQQSLRAFRNNDLDVRIKAAIEEAIGNMVPKVFYTPLKIQDMPRSGTHDPIAIAEDMAVKFDPKLVKASKETEDSLAYLKENAEVINATLDSLEALKIPTPEELEDAIVEARVNVAEPTPTDDEDWESILPVSDGLPKAPVYLKKKSPKVTKTPRGYLDAQKRIAEINLLPKIEKTEMLLRLIEVCDRNHHAINLYKKERRSKWGIIPGYIMIIGNASSDWNKGHMMKTAGCIEKLERFIAAHNLS